MKFFVVLLLVALVAGQGEYDDVPDYGWDEPTVLDDYVWLDDGYFSWTIIGEYNYGDDPEDPDVTVFMVNMTSQMWTDETYCDHPVWWHWVGIAVPRDRISDDTALMAIAGGNNKDPEEPPVEDSSENVGLSVVANDTGIICAYVLQVPNQPIIFTNDPEQKSRSEDDIIAWTWRTYLDAPEAERDQAVILRNPMTKSAKRALDTVTEVLLQERGMNVNRFIPSGGSKRGWTTWSLAAVDTRVIAQIPLVFSLLNIDEAIMKHYQALNGWSFAFAPYYEVNLTLELHNPVTQEIWDMEDMFRYRSRYTMPKLLMSTTGDEFFLNHDSHSWMDGMTAPMYFWMIANAEHSMAPHYPKIYQGIAAFCHMVIKDGAVDMPELEWTRRENVSGGIIEARTEKHHIEHPVHGSDYEVTAFRAVTLENDTRRDYRLFAGYPDVSFHPVVWRSRDQELLEIVDDDYYNWIHYTEKYDDEWVGHLIEVIFDRYGFDYYLSTEVNVMPNTFPAEECFGEGCYGELV